jgi:hypothetical protein
MAPRDAGVFTAAVERALDMLGLREAYVIADESDGGQLRLSLYAPGADGANFTARILGPVPGEPESRLVVLNWCLAERPASDAAQAAIEAAAAAAADFLLDRLHDLRRDLRREFSSAGPRLPGA